jgi:hypothetical protein
MPLSTTDSSVYVRKLEQENPTLREQLVEITEQLSSFRYQLDWFKCQLFGRKSEKQLEVDTSLQANLLADLESPLRIDPPKPLPTNAARNNAMPIRSTTADCVLMTVCRYRSLKYAIPR